HQALVALRILPPDTTPATLQQWGLDKIDVVAALALNTGFDEAHLRRFYERVGAAILDRDPRAVFYLEGTLNLGSVLGGGASGGIAGMWNITMTRPRGLEQVVFAPHWYPDIYPFLGFDQPPRQFTPEQVRFRDYQADLEKARDLASFSLGNTPVVFGEFGSYFNFN